MLVHNVLIVAQTVMLKPSLAVLHALVQVIIILLMRQYQIKHIFKFSADVCSGPLRSYFVIVAQTVMQTPSLAVLHALVQVIINSYDCCQLIHFRTTRPRVI